MQINKTYHWRWLINYYFIIKSNQDSQHILYYTIIIYYICKYEIIHNSQYYRMISPNNIVKYSQYPFYTSIFVNACQGGSTSEHFFPRSLARILRYILFANQQCPTKSLFLYYFPMQTRQFGPSLLSCFFKGLLAKIQILPEFLQLCGATFAAEKQLLENKRRDRCPSQSN